MNVMKSLKTNRMKVRRLIGLAAGIGATVGGWAAEPRVVEGLDLELLWGEAGEFVMGSPASEPARDKAEGPQTRVTLSEGLWLGRTEVTQAQYAAIMDENPSTFQETGPDGPVERVSWIDAMEFCERLTERDPAWFI